MSSIYNDSEHSTRGVRRPISVRKSAYLRFAGMYTCDFRKDIFQCYTAGTKTEMRMRNMSLLHILACRWLKDFEGNITMAC